MLSDLERLVQKLVEETNADHDLEKALEICNEIHDEILFKLVMRDMLVPETT